MVPETLRIIHRPEEIEARIVPGRWEGYLIKCAFNRSSVGTLVERKTRFVIVCKMTGNGAEAALDSFFWQMRRLPAVMRKSMTYDRESEMACHSDLAIRCRMAHKRQAQKNAWMENTRRNHGLKINRCA